MDAPWRRGAPWQGRRGDGACRPFRLSDEKALGANGYGVAGGIAQRAVESCSEFAGAVIGHEGEHAATEAATMDAPGAFPL